VNKYLQLFRFQNGVIGVIGILAAAFIASGANVTDHWENVIVACAVVAVFMAGGNALNDYVDRDIDVVAHPERPVPSGRMKARHALYAGLGALGISVAMSLFFRDILSIAMVAAACVMMLSYEIRLKRTGFAGNVTIAILTGMIFLVGGAVAGNVEKTFALAGMAALVNIGREIAKDIEDMEGDEGRDTLPMKIGTRNAAVAAAAFFVAGTALSILPAVTGMFGLLYIAIIVPDAMFIYASYVLFKDPCRSQKVAKIAMLAALAAFMAGVV